MAYYSSKSPKIYHNCKNCHVGDNMVKENLRKGRPKTVKGRKPPILCKICAGLRKTGKFTTGIPILPDTQPGAKVEAYYSKEYPEIFHICQNCYLGQNIERRNLIEAEPKPVKGRGGKIKKPRLCKVCTRMCIGGECMTGTPIVVGGRRPRLPVSQAKTGAPKLVKAGK